MGPSKGKAGEAMQGPHRRDVQGGQGEGEEGVQAPGFSRWSRCHVVSEEAWTCAASLLPTTRPSNCTSCYSS